MSPPSKPAAQLLEGGTSRGSNSTPIEILPAEIVSHILDLSVEGITQALRYSRVTNLSLVSKAWLEIVNATPELWNHIYFDSSGPLHEKKLTYKPRLIPYIKYCIAKSSSRLLHITGDYFFYPWNKDILNEFHQLILDASTRWKTISLETKDAHLAWLLFAGCDTNWLPDEHTLRIWPPPFSPDMSNRPALPAPSPPRPSWSELRALTLTFEAKDNKFTANASLHQFDMPNLKYLEINGMPSSQKEDTPLSRYITNISCFPLGTIKHLVMKDSYQSSQFYTDLLPLCHRLETCELSVKWARWLSHAHPALNFHNTPLNPQPAPRSDQSRGTSRIRCLKITESSSLEVLASFASSILLPNLTDLTVSFECGDQSAHGGREILRDLIVQSGCNLTSLSLSRISLGDVLLKNLLSITSSLQNFELEEVSPKFGLDFIKVLNPSKMLPQLINIRIVTLPRSKSWQIDQGEMEKTILNSFAKERGFGVQGRYEAEEWCHRLKSSRLERLEF